MPPIRSITYRYVHHCGSIELHLKPAQRWNGRFFDASTLQSIGLVVQLGHEDGRRCPAPALAPRSFVVLHTNGFHPVNVQFCQCDQVQFAGTRVQQLLRFELFPATLEDPSTCCTLRLLETFHVLTLQSKITAYDFYLTLEKLTDELGVRRRYVSVMYFVVLRCAYPLAGPPQTVPADDQAVASSQTADACRPWARLGRGERNSARRARHSLSRVPDAWGEPTRQLGDDVRRFEVCPVCVYYVCSLLTFYRFIYTTFIAIDANFRLKRRAISSDSRDPSLSSGWGCFVEGLPYREHILRYVDQQDVSCYLFVLLGVHRGSLFVV